jgi:hypothetical protein
MHSPLPHTGAADSSVGTSSRHMQLQEAEEDLTAKPAAVEGNSTRAVYAYVLPPVLAGSCAPVLYSSCMPDFRWRPAFACALVWLQLRQGEPLPVCA